MALPLGITIECQAALHRSVSPMITTGDIGMHAVATVHNDYDTPCAHVAKRQPVCSVLIPAGRFVDSF